MDHEVQTHAFGTEPDDKDVVSAWYAEHRHGAIFPTTVLPPHGVVASVYGERLAAAWVYLSFGIGVAHIHWAVGKPRTAPKLLVAAWRAVFRGIEDVCRAHNCFVIFCNARPDVAHGLRRAGFESIEPQVFTYKVLTQ